MINLDIFPSRQPSQEELSHHRDTLVEENQSYINQEVSDDVIEGLKITDFKANQLLTEKGILLVKELGLMPDRIGLYSRRFLSNLTERVTDLLATGLEKEQGADFFRFELFADETTHLTSILELADPTAGKIPRLMTQYPKHRDLQGRLLSPLQSDLLRQEYFRTIDQPSNPIFDLAVVTYISKLLQDTPQEIVAIYNELLPELSSLQRLSILIKLNEMNSSEHEKRPLAKLGDILSSFKKTGRFVLGKNAYSQDLTKAQGRYEVASNQLDVLNDRRYVKRWLKIHGPISLALLGLTATTLQGSDTAMLIGFLSSTINTWRISNAVEVVKKSREKIHDADDDETILFIIRHELCHQLSTSHSKDGTKYKCGFSIGNLVKK